MKNKSENEHGVHKSIEYRFREKCNKLNFIDIL